MKEALSVDSCSSENCLESGGGREQKGSLHTEEQCTFRW